MEKEIILYSDDKAAKYKTDIRGWICSKGRFHGEDEDSARISGSTHRVCKSCKTILSNNCFLICKNCAEKKKISRYKALKSIKWDMETPIYSDRYDEYCLDFDAMCDFMENTEGELSSLTFNEARFFLCVPVYLSTIDDDFFYDDLPEDGEVHDEVKDAMDNLNEVILNQNPCSWFPGKIAVFLEEDNEQS